MFKKGQLALANKRCRRRGGKREVLLQADELVVVLGSLNGGYFYRVYSPKSQRYVEVNKRFLRHA